MGFGIGKALKRTASLLPVMPKSRPLYRGNAAITILRVFLWLMPAFLIPLLAVLGGFLSKYLPAPANISLMLLLWVAATAGIGLFEELLRFQQLRLPLAASKRDQMSSPIVFVLTQIIVAPTVVSFVFIVIAAIARSVFF
jgi:hypothetical protein